MTAAAVAIGRPKSALLRGGDCHVLDLAQDRLVYGPHRFAASTDLHIGNGLIRCTIGAVGAVPSLTVQSYAAGALLSAATTYDDTTVYDDTTMYYDDIYAHAWTAKGSVVIDSSLVTAILTGAKLVSCTPERVILRLVAPAISDAFVALHRGEPFLRIQHGNTRGTQVVTSRKVSWSASPSPVGVSYSGRISEDGAPTAARFVAARTAGATINVAAFSASVAGVATAEFGAGVGTTTQGLTSPADLHAQMYDASYAQTIIVKGT